MPNMYLDSQRLNQADLIKMSGMDYKRTKKAPYVLLDFKSGLGNPMHWMQGSFDQKAVECLKNGNDICELVKAYAVKSATNLQ